MLSISEIAVASGLSGSLKLSFRRKLSETTTRNVNVKGLTITQVERLAGKGPSAAFMSALDNDILVSVKDTEKVGEDSYPASCFATSAIVKADINGENPSEPAVETEPAPVKSPRKSKAKDYGYAPSGEPVPAVV